MGTSAGSTVPRHVLKKTPSARDMGGRGYGGKILLVRPCVHTLCILILLSRLLQCRFDVLSGANAADAE